MPSQHIGSVGADGRAAYETAARLAIQDVAANFSHGLDDRNPDYWLAAFHDDAVLVLDAGTAIYTGHNEILGKARQMWNLPAMSHLTGNHIINFIDSDTATGLSRGFGLFQLPDLSYILTTVRIEDQYLRRARVWRLARCTVAIISSVALQAADAIRLDK